MTDNIILRTEDLHKSFGKLEVLKGITTTIRRGEVVSIIGPSGGGKSTFLRCLNLLEEPTSGKVYFKDEDITDKKVSNAKFRQSIGMVFQNFNVFPNMTVLIVTHEMGFAREVSDRVLFICDGIIKEEGSPDQIFTCPHDPATIKFLSMVL